MAASVKFQTLAVFLKFFKNHAKHQIVAQKYIQTNKSDVKFPAKHNPVLEKIKKIVESWKI